MIVFALAAWAATVAASGRVVASASRLGRRRAATAIRVAAGSFLAVTVVPAVAIAVFGVLLGPICFAPILGVLVVVFGACAARSSPVGSLVAVTGTAAAAGGVLGLYTFGLEPTSVVLHNVRLAGGANVGFVVVTAVAAAVAALTGPDIELPAEAPRKPLPAEDDCEAAVDVTQLGDYL